MKDLHDFHRDVQRNGDDVVIQHGKGPEFDPSFFIQIFLISRRENIGMILKGALSGLLSEARKNSYQEDSAKDSTDYHQNSQEEEHQV